MLIKRGIRIKYAQHSCNQVVLLSIKDGGTWISSCCKLSCFGTVKTIVFCNTFNPYGIPDQLASNKEYIRSLGAD